MYLKVSYDKNHNSIVVICVLSANDRARHCSKLSKCIISFNSHSS